MKFKFSLFSQRDLRRVILALAALSLLTASSLARAEEHAKAEEKGEGAAADATSREPSFVYVHQWIGMPALTGHDLETGETVTIAPEKGKMQIVLFLASWCEPCQQMVTDYRKLAERYRKLHADFIYVFAHDTKDDASDFMKEYHLSSGLLANHDILKVFHNPELPTIYVGDRHGWMATRYVKAGASDLAQLDDFLKNLTAY